QGFAERLVLHLVAAADRGRVGREEHEGLRRIALVLGEVEAYASDEVPGGIQSGEEGLRSAVSLAQLAQRRVDFVPQRLEHLDGQVLATDELRCRSNELLHLGARRIRALR